MQRFLVVNSDVVCCLDADGSVCTVADLPTVIGQGRGPLVFAVVPQASGRVLATARTLDSAMPQQFPELSCFSSELLETNTYMVYAASDEFLKPLRDLGRDVWLVPYPAVVRMGLGAHHGSAEKTGFIERTRVALRTAALRIPGAEGHVKDQMAIDVVGDGLLLTALHGKEVAATRFIQGGDALLEVQRTIAGARLDTPTICVKDNDLVMEFQAHGFTAELVESAGHVLGEPALQKSTLDKLQPLRFLNEQEVMQQKAIAGRLRTFQTLLVSLVPMAGALAANIYFGHQQNAALLESQELQRANDEASTRLTALYQERYASLARKKSLHVGEEFTDLWITLPPQVSLIEVQKTETMFTAVIERRAQAAPFSRDDLVAALSTSPYFADADIQEQYEGHQIRYILTKNRPLSTGLPTSPGAAR